MIAMPQRTTYILLTALMLTTACATAQKAKLYTTDGTRTYSLTETSVEGELSSNVRSAIVLKPEEANQSIDGFGFAITYSSCYNLLKMEPEARKALLRKTYSKTEGYGVSYARISLGCNDFSSIFTLEQDLSMITEGLSARGLASFSSTGSNTNTRTISPFYYAL